MWAGAEDPGGVRGLAGSDEILAVTSLAQLFGWRREGGMTPERNGISHVNMFDPHNFWEGKQWPITKETNGEYRYKLVVLKSLKKWNL